jgi:hypothetical protein
MDLIRVQYQAFLRLRWLEFTLIAAALERIAWRELLQRG